MSATHEIVKYSIRMNHYMSIPRIALYELDDAEYRVYSYYVDEARWTNRPIETGCRAGAKLLGYGKDKFQAARQRLHDKGYIVITPGEKVADPDVVEIQASVWQRNDERYGSAEASLKQTVEDILGDRFSPEQLEVIMEALARKGVVSGAADTSVPEIRHRVGQDRHQCPDFQTDSNIKESKKEKDSLSPGVPPRDEDEASPDFEDSEPYVPPGIREMFESKGHLEEDAPADISDRALTLWLLKELGVKKLGAKALKNLRNKIVRKDEDGSHTHPSPVDLYDSDDSYREFCADRLARFKAMNDGVVDSDQFTLSIRKMHNPEHDTNKQKWPGYL